MKNGKYINTAAALSRYLRAKIDKYGYILTYKYVSTYYLDIRLHTMCSAS